jgi:hypothetical protein
MPDPDMVLAEAIEGLEALVGQHVEVLWGPIGPLTDTGLSMAGGMRGTLQSTHPESSAVTDQLPGRRAYFYGFEGGGEIHSWFAVEAARLQDATSDETSVFLNFGTYALQVALLPQPDD